MTERNSIADALEAAIAAARKAGLHAIAARLEAIARRVRRPGEADAA